ncbi:pentatricopeptide repeat-containing protein At2g37320 [Argentina anserina]|uniref:pentatricopeptide repeat-containing protein At2g37320 n=1 Tax=Argentina anserina TaxID=57926 RepID=UPI00217668D2|nr:pentatricopeptide repeat-containing protein At2g37320 [Potentilla anserina]
MGFSFRLGKRLSHSFLHTHSGRLRPSPSQKLRQILQQSRKHSNALRVLDLITPKPTISAPRRQAHLRLIEGFLRSDSDQFSNPSSLSSSHASTQFSDLFNELFDSSSVDYLNESFTADASVILQAISSCGSKRDLHGSSLISFYSKCSELENAYKVFDEMPVRNVVSWTAIISGYAQEWQVDVCLEPLGLMRCLGLKPNDFTYASVLSACTGRGALGQGKCAHGQTIRMGFDSYIHIARALMSMYCKCGAVKDALYMFENLDGKDTVSWNSMIAGYGPHGHALQAIGLFEEMKKQGLKPEGITLLGVLSACRHGGLVRKGLQYFNSMVEEHCIQPELDHYSCIIDLLGRAGLLDEARVFIEKMPIHPNAVIWGSLLSSCRVHRSVWIGIEAAESRLLMEPGCASTHVQLANLYARLGCWDEAARVRKLMKYEGIKTSPGFSWIEIGNEVPRFRAEDGTNLRIIEIVGVLDCLAGHMVRLKASGCELQKQEEKDAS